MKKVTWASRHPMTADQDAELRKMFGDDMTVETVNMTWFATPDAEQDVRRNQEEWDRLAEGADVIAGVFPPVALEALDLMGSSKRVTVMTPVSRQAPELRASPDAPIPFTHIRWVTLRRW